MDIDSNLLQLWWHHQEMAMHFNELLMQYRLHLFGGSGLFGAIASYYISTHISDNKKRLFVTACVSTFLFLFIVGAAALDLCYYNVLLQGTVDALLKLEETSTHLFLSTSIENKFTSRGTEVAWYIYGVAILFSLSFTLWAWINYKKK